jgi:putative glycosyltransferase (TIGR04348 family)
LRIVLAIPTPPGLVDGNRITALRWARLLRSLGHRARVVERYDGRPADLLVALHAIKAAGDVSAYAAARPEGKIVVILTGTDVYGNLRHSPVALEVLARAGAVVALQEDAASRVPARFRDRVHVVHQSAEPLRSPPPRPRRTFRAAVVGHLRTVKDPFRPAQASRLVPRASRLEVVHAGAATSPAQARRAQAEEARSPRYRWIGPVSPARARRLIAGSHVVVIPSRAEGSSNVLSEALADGTAVLAAEIPGMRDALGADYPGWFPPGDAHALAALLWSCESDAAFLGRLRAAVRRRAPLVRPARERAALRRLLAAL